MTDTPDDDRPRRNPAEPGSVIDMRAAPPTRKPGAGEASDAPPPPPIESSLVGKGDLPAMDRKPAAEAPLRLGERVDLPGGSAGATPADTVARSPDNGMSGPSDAADTDADRAGSASVTTASASASSIPPVSPRPPAPPPASAALPAAPRRAARRGGFAPLFLGGLVAAGLGAGAAWWAIPRLPAAWQPPAPAADLTQVTEAAAAAARAEVERQSAAVESRAAEAARQAAEAASKAAGASLAAGSDQLLQQARDAGAEAAAKLIAEAPASAQPDGALQTTLAAQAQQLAALDEAIKQLRAAPAAGAPADLKPLQDQIAAQAAELQALAQRPAVDPATADQLTRLAADAEAATARITAAADQAEARLREAEAKGAELTAAADEAARRARAAAAAAAIGEAMQTGAPRTAALAELQEAGIEPPAALTAKLPTLEQLAAEFPPAARAAVRAALKAEAAQGRGSVVGNFLRAQTGARSVAPREGTDADAVLSRAGDAVQRGEIARALDELAALPEPARPAMEAWTARARAWADAQAALTGLTGGASIAPAAADAPSAGSAAPAAAAPGAAASTAPAPAAPAPTTAPASPAPADPAAAPAPAAPSN